MMENILAKYRQLHDGLSNMIEDGRLTEDAIPDDYQWLVEALAELAGLDPEQDPEYTPTNFFNEEGVVIKRL